MDPSATYPNDLRTILEDMEVDINEVDELRVYYDFIRFIITYFLMLDYLAAYLFCTGNRTWNFWSGLQRCLEIQSCGS